MPQQELEHTISFSAVNYVESPTRVNLTDGNMFMKSIEVTQVLPAAEVRVVRFFPLQN